jgi:hypothetical protein
MGPRTPSASISACAESRISARRRKEEEVKVKTNLRFRNQLREARKRNANVGDPALASRLVFKSGPESDLPAEDENR